MKKKIKITGNGVAERSSKDLLDDPSVRKAIHSARTLAQKVCPKPHYVIIEEQAKRIAELEAKVEQLEAENALMKKKAHVSFGCFWNGGWYSNVGTEGHIDHSPTPPAEGDGNE